MWFKKKNAADGASTPTPLNFERLGEAMRRLDWNFETNDGHYRAFFEEYATVFEVADEGKFFSVYSWSSGYFDGEHRFMEALRWAQQWNAETVYGTARPYVDDDKDVIMRVDISFLAGAGLTDEQLDKFLQVAVACNIQAIEKYIEDLGLQKHEAPEPADG